MTYSHHPHPYNSDIEAIQHAKRHQLIRDIAALINSTADLDPVHRLDMLLVLRSLPLFISSDRLKDEHPPEVETGRVVDIKVYYHE